MTKEERYQKRKDHCIELHKNSADILCLCGCGELLKEVNVWGRKRKYISGHNNKKYNCKKEHKRMWAEKARTNKSYVKYTKNNNRLRCQKLKADLLCKKGGCCERCGLLYDITNACCFDFHHIEPDTKSFNVNSGTFNRFSKERVYVEAEKCIILCANCHRIEHQLNEY